MSTLSCNAADGTPGDRTPGQGLSHPQSLPSGSPGGIRVEPPPIFWRRLHAYLDTHAGRPLTPDGGLRPPWAPLLLSLTKGRWCGSTDLHGHWL